jgi:hypothetical protein
LSEHPPKNRMPTAIRTLRIEIEHGSGIEVLDPNGLAEVSITDPQRITELPLLPDRVSVISSQPAVLYRADDLAVPLAPEELLRPATRDLSSAEFFALRVQYGDAFEWHSNFYDSTTGRALQPYRRQRG